MAPRSWLVGALILPLVLLLGSTLTACSGVTAEEEPTLGDVIIVTSPNQIVLPLDAYQPSREQQTTTIQAHRILTRKCASRYGVQYAPGTFDIADVGSLNERRYGIVLESDASSSGYRPPQRLVGPSGKEEGSGWDPIGYEFEVVRGRDQRTQDSREGKLVNGVPIVKDGCAGEAERTLQKGVGADDSTLTFPDTLAHTAYDSARSDSRLLEAFGRWSTCMASAGYQFGDPFEANDKETGAQVTDGEIAQALADVKCRRTENLVGLWLAVETAYQVRLIEQNAEALTNVRKAYDQRLANAAAALAGPAT